ncbi:MAG: C25 family cysteine peptidase, partial [Parabacteroides gordonii]|nr:C25 family cysteine peptidase [Parabacteroides gordonii]
RFPIKIFQDMVELCNLYVNYSPQENDKILIVPDGDVSKVFVKELQTILKPKTVTCLNKKGTEEDISTLQTEIPKHSFILYTGHGNPLYWNYGDLETQFTESKVPIMSQHPHVCCWACATSCFSITKADCIGVSWIKKGAMTYWGASYTTRRSVNQKMAKEMLNTVLLNPTMSVGEVYFHVLGSSVSQQEEKERYHLFGDPTLPFFSK